MMWRDKITHFICTTNSAHTNRCQGESYEVGGANWGSIMRRKGGWAQMAGCTRGREGGTRPFGQQVMQSLGQSG